MDTDFFKALYRGMSGYVYLWSNPSKTSRAFSITDLDFMVEKAMILNGEHRDVYFSIGATDNPVKHDERAKQSEITSIGAVWADIDIADTTAHKSDKLPPDIAAAMTVLPPEFPPSIIVSSGHGLHVYWLLDTPVIITDQNRDDVVITLRKVQQLIRNNAATHQWIIDSTADLSRVLRVPETWNFKNEEAALCEVIDSSDIRYQYKQFAELTVEAPKKLKNRGKEFERRSTDGDAGLMVANCAFLQHVQLDAGNITYDEWLAALSNLARAQDGVAVCHEISSIDEKRYDEKKCQAKIDEVLSSMSPATCDHIKTTIGFAGCNNCQVKCPSSWALAKIPKARAIIRKIANPTAETVFTEEVLGSLAILEKEDSLEYTKFKSKLKGKVNLNDFNREMAGHRRKGMHVVAAGEDARSVTTQSILNDCPIDLILPVNFTFDNAGIYEIRQCGEGNIQKNMATGSPVVITSRIYNMDNSQEKIEICFKYYNQWRKTVQPRSVVFNSRMIIKLADWGCNVSSETAKYLVKFLQEMERVNIKAIPLAYSVMKLGWRNNDTEFILPTRTSYRIDMDDEGDVVDAFQEMGTLESWINIASKVRMHPFARLVLAASFAAPLLKPLKQRNFLLYFWGTSGGGKTAAIKFAESVWGVPDKLMTSFLTTKNGLERRLELMSDFPVGINERQVAGGGREKQEQLEYIAYMLEGGKGKGRANKTGLQKTAAWRVIGIANGEEPLTKENSIQGVKNRVLEINTSPILPDELARECHTNQNCGIAGSTYIEKLLRNKQEVLAIYDTIQNTLSNKHEGHSPSHMFAMYLIATADYLSSIWIFGLTPDVAMQQAIYIADTTINELPTLSEVSDVNRAWDFVQGWLSSNAARFDDGITQHVLSPTYGFRKNGELCVYPQWLNAALTEAGFSPDKLMREFGNAGKIEVEYENSTGKCRYTKRMRDASGKRVRMVAIKEDG